MSRCSVGVYIYFIRPGQNLKQYGPWAVVTGATDGIGRAYADVLAAAGPIPFQLADRVSIVGINQMIMESIDPWVCRSEHHPSVKDARKAGGCSHGHLQEVQCEDGSRCSRSESAEFRAVKEA